MEKENFFVKNKKYLFAAAFMVLFLVIGVLIGVLSNKAPVPDVDQKDPKPLTEEILSTEEAADAVTEEKKESYSLVPLMEGIDVSKWQGKPDWARVKANGVEFAMVRLGFRGADGSFGEDECAYYNLENADKNGILTGVYFYSRATSEEDARKEAEWILNRVGKYAISMPIVMDYEMAGNSADITAVHRTDIALAFLNRIASAGYRAMIYVPTEEFEDSSLWEKDRILSEYSVWGARYDGKVYPEMQHPNEEISYAMWQYSNTGMVDGISGNVDLDLAYFTAERIPPQNPVEEQPKEAEDQISEPTEEAVPKKEFNQTFTPVSRLVTAKIEVNLRKIPSIDGELVGTLKKGDYLPCTGDSDMGWSRLEYEGEKVYAVTSYLMDENGLSIVPKQKFQSVSEKVTAKIEVNLRLEPSNEAEIVGTLQNGIQLTRTGVGDKGWSRLEWEGKTVYAITSYLFVVQ